MTPWRRFEFRGRDVSDNPFVDFGFVVSDGGRFGLSSHLLRDPLWVDDAEQIIPAFRGYFTEQGFAKLRYKVLWEKGAPVDTPFEVGWQDM
jgi:hypothetical protein